MLGKKYGFDFLPKDHRGLLSEDKPDGNDVVKE
jgi:hypothetical protein